MQASVLAVGAALRDRLSLCVLALCALALTPTPSQAQGETTWYKESHRQIRGSSNVSPLGPNLFGDQVSLYSGRIEFVQNDLEVPGNNNLPVGISRRLTSGRDMVNNAGMFGDWDIEIPRLQGIFASGARNKGWAVDFPPSNYHKRCTEYAAPPVGFAMGASGYVWEPEEYWYGNSLYVPGQGAQSMMLRAPGNTLQPTGGGYPIVTKGGWQIQCLPTISNDRGSGNIQGEAFSALAPDGTRWRFDHLVERRTTTLVKTATSGGVGGARDSLPTGAGASDAASTRTPIFESTATQNYRLERSEFWMLPTQAVDRFGNTLTYTYDTVNPWKLIGISSSDGRALTFTHDGTSQRIRTVNDGSRTWTYEYCGSTLVRVVRPDASAWTFSNSSAFKNIGPGYMAPPSCEYAGQLESDPQTVTMPHPSGAEGQFTVASILHGRTNVPQGGCAYSTRAARPKWFADRSLTQKVIRGPGMADATWTYAYSAPTPGWAPCGSECIPTKTVSITDPSSAVTRSTFGTRYGMDEGKLLLEEVIAPGGAILRTASTRYRSPSSGPYPDPVGYSQQQLMDNNDLARYHPVDQRIITQQGVAFTWQADSFDSQARAIQVTRFSDFSYTRTETTAYNDNLDLWVLGQVASVSVGGLVQESHQYYPATALRKSTSNFGLLKSQYEYHPDGTLHKVADAVNPPTVLTNYYRGVPRNIKHPDDTTESADVSNLGLVTSVTNAVGTTTSYGYDAIGRLSSIGYPAETGGGYHATTISYQQIWQADVGLPAGHWRQTTTTGNNHTIRYLDGMWRERLRHQYDSANITATGRVVETRYDADGRRVFQSYPLRSLSNVGSYRPGQSWEHDALDRVTVQRQDSELGVLTSTAAYLDEFKKRVTNARGHATIFRYQVFDEPTEDSIAAIEAPLGVSVAIPRDTFGKALSITRSGTWGNGSVSATRSYVYDAHQRLCKRVEPETGATIQSYDAAGNIHWRASGQSTTGTGSCNQSDVNDGSEISYVYDARNRLTSTSFGDGQPGITRTYSPDSLLWQTISSSFTWTYTYNNRRLLTQEALSV
jgi:YD repeat-containing protein